MKSLTLFRGVALSGALTLSHAVTALAAGTSASTSGGESTPLNLGSGASATHSSSGSSSVVRTIVGLLIVIAVIYGISWIMRKAKRGRGGRVHGTGLTAIATLPLGSGRSVQLVRAGREVLLIGVAEHGITPIRTYTEAEAVEAGLELTAEDPAWADQEERPGGRVVDAVRRLTVRS
jgi:flagellar protein FliO/FliZ